MSRGAAEVNGATTVPAGAAKVVDSFFGRRSGRKGLILSSLRNYFFLLLRILFKAFVDPL